MDSGVLVPLVRELLSLRLRPGFLRVYLVGSALALMGALVGVAEMLQQTFCTDHAQTGPDEQYEELLNTLREITHTHTNTHKHSYDEQRALLHVKEERLSFNNWRPLEHATPDDIP